MRFVGSAYMRPRIVLTYGIMDLIHPGHLNLLIEAKKLGDRLVVGIGSDYSVNREPKKKWKTIMSSEDRALIVGSLRMVDAVFIYPDYEQLERMIEIIRPDVYVRGDDWTADFPGKKTLEKLRIPIEFVGYTKGISSTDIKKKVFNVGLNVESEENTRR